MNADHRLIAYAIHPRSDMLPEPAAPTRDWMDETNQRNAYRCLPLVIANQSGWVLRSPTPFSVRWNGGTRATDLRIWFPRGHRDPRICSHFGNGILTIGIPHLFRTPPGINLWVKGPANAIKDGIQALEGVVETDWSDYTFTMNWRVTRPNHLIRFEQDEPVCMIVPVPRGLAESLEPISTSLRSDRELHRRFRRWDKSRTAFNTALAERDEEAVAQAWQRDYQLGRGGAAGPIAGHQTKLHLRSFRKQSSVPSAPRASAIGDAKPAP
jgi:hypothetical protein